MPKTYTNVGIAGLSVLGGPLVVWIDTTEQAEIVTIGQIDTFGAMAAAARAVSRALTLIPPGPLRLPRPLSLKPARQFVVDPHHPDILLATQRAQEHLYQLWQQLHQRYPQYEILPNGLTYRNIYFAKAMEYGYHEQVHRRHTLWGLARWVYYNQHLYVNLREMPAWWCRLFPECGEKRLSKLMGESERRQRLKRVRTRVRPKRRL